MMQTSSTDAGKGDQAVTEQLWTRLSEDLRRYIGRRVAPSDVEDVLQIVFLRLHAQRGTLRDDDRVIGWVYAVARNAITDYYRAASRRRELAVPELPGHEHPVAQFDEPDDESEAELAACLRPLLARLPSEQAAALELVEFSGLSQVEAAKSAGVSVSGMKSRVQRGRARLREQLLSCCHITRDVRGRVQEWQPRAGDCDCSR